MPDVPETHPYCCESNPGGFHGVEGDGIMGWVLAVDVELTKSAGTQNNLFECGTLRVGQTTYRVGQTTHQKAAHLLILTTRPLNNLLERFFGLCHTQVGWNSHP